MEIQHPLLRRQLKRLIEGSTTVPDAWAPLVAVVDQTYVEAETDRLMLERSLDLSSQELLHANAQLRAAGAELERRVRARTADLVCANEALRREIAERRRIEEQLRHAQKMEAVGRLAGGVAHDFNNLLTVIIGFTELLQAQAPGDSPQSGTLEEIRAAADRAATLTRQLLAFSRRQLLQPKVLALNETIGHLTQMLRTLIGEQVTLETRLAPELGLVRADPSQIDQVLVNLVANARDATPAGGTITVETANVAIDGAIDALPLDVPAGAYVQLSVRDTGHGMDDATRSRVFEPFFTTKDAKQGTGLGLSTAYGIVKQSGGVITVSSAPGEGTAFDVYLPRIGEGAVAPEAPAPEPLPVAPARGETILLVEDEDAVRALARVALEQRGYVVLEAATCGEAVARVEQHAGPIHLLLSDLVMPDGSGPSIAEQLADLGRGTKVLYMSGYADNTAVRNRILDAGTPFLQKPFTTASLERKVREVIDRGAGG